MEFQSFKIIQDFKKSKKISNDQELIQSDPTSVYMPRFFFCFFFFPSIYLLLHVQFYITLFETLQVFSSWHEVWIVSFKR